MSEGWVHRLRARELGAKRNIAVPLPSPNTGTLVLDSELTVNSVPGGMLAHLTAADGVHYVDLGGVHATSLSEFGGSADFWRGVTKLYASNCALRSLDGLATISAVRCLYLDHNALPAEQLARLCTELPAGQLQALDISGNPGAEDNDLMQTLLSSGVIAGCDFVNGRRLRDAAATAPAADSWGEV